MYGLKMNRIHLQGGPMNMSLVQNIVEKFIHPNFELLNLK